MQKLMKDKKTLPETKITWKMQMIRIGITTTPKMVTGTSERILLRHSWPPKSCLQNHSTLFAMDQLVLRSIKILIYN